MNNPVITIDKAKYVFEYNEAGITFKNVRYDDTVNPYVTRGELLYLDNRYKEAFPLVKEAAENGNPRAMYIMARYYYDGYETVTINEKERNNWYEKAYSYKETLSMYGYAAWCLENDSEKQNTLYEQLFNDVKKLADKNDTFAQGIIGWMYDCGKGVIQDYAEAVKWYRKAAEGGYVHAQCNLGYMYENGYGIEQDKSKAVEWYRKSAEQGYARGQRALGYMYQKGFGITQDYTKALDWYKKAAEQGYDIAMCDLGFMYENGYGVEKDYAKAVEWYRKTAEQGNAIAQANLGCMYVNGYGVEKDYARLLSGIEKL